MPAFERRDRYQTAVLWQATGSFDNYAVPIVTPPVEVQVRWKGGQSEAVGPDGQTITLDATAVVDRLIPIGSRMWLGTLRQWYSAPGSGGEDNQVSEVKTCSGTPDIKDRNVAYKVGLMRWHSKT